MPDQTIKLKGRATDPGSSLPTLYARWMDEFLHAPLPAEVCASCSECPMVPPHSGSCGCDVVFHPNTKCCTFMPAIPNFLAGAVLSDDSPESAEGRAVFERNAAARAVVNPLGVFPTAPYSATYRLNYITFGKREAMLCPNYLREGGRCGIWPHRNGHCSTWFCKHGRGAAGQRLWMALDRLLAAVEGSLAKWCLLQMNLEPRVLAELIPATGIPAGGPATWGAWARCERQFFRACWLLVEPLSWERVMAIAGPEVRILALLAGETFRRWQRPMIPERLRCGPWNVEPVDSQRSRVWAYSILDPLDLDTPLLEALSCFDGSPTRETLNRIQSEYGIRLDCELLQKLCDFRILVETDSNSRMSNKELRTQKDALDESAGQAAK